VPGATSVPASTIPPPSTVVPPTEAPGTDPPLPPDPPNGQEVIPPPVDVVIIDPGDQVVDGGTLDEPERTELEQEVDPVPPGAPPAGLGGASRSSEARAGWAAGGGFFLTVAGVTILVLGRRRSAT
jgi:hypothetical protein